MLNQSKIASKILAPILGLALLLILIVVSAIWLQSRVAVINRMAADASAQMIEASEVRALSRAIQRDALKLSIDNWSSRQKSLDESINARAALLIARARRLSEMVNPTETDMASDFVGLQETVVSEIGAVKASALSDKAADARDQFIKRLEPVEKAASKLTDRFIEATEKRIHELSVEADRVRYSAQSAMLVAGIASLLAGLGASTFIAFRGIIFPLRGVMSAMARVSAGDYSSSIEGSERGDEIGRIAKAVAAIRDAGLENARLERDAEALRALTESERGRTEEQRRQSEAEQAAVVAAIAENLEKIAKGDLTARIEAEFDGHYHQIQTDFNAAIARLEETIQSVTGNADAINSGAREISAAAVELSRRTEHQASSLEETAAALDEITTTVRMTAEGAAQAREVVAQARSEAEKSGLVMRRAVDAMGKIEKSSQQISQIVSVIDEIAFQTNLLALNAGVEAARAGDAGRGFAVVASEVRALAQRSAEAAKEIKGLIATSNGEVGDGVKSVVETEQALDRIVAKVSDINVMVGEIAAMAHEQSTGLLQVNSAVNQMDQVTQQNAAMSEEATAASRSLLQEAERLSGLIGQFQVGQENGARKAA
ncbi:MAG: methyl-accepting chemotaxis protein [Beijerinckiaceae bacterium]